MGIIDKIMGKDADDNKPRPNFSDVQGGSSSTAPQAPVAATPTAAPATAAARTYTVASGDSLSKIAKREYGDGSKWHAIFEANRDKLKDPDLIQPGQVLKIPSQA